MHFTGFPSHTGGLNFDFISTCFITSERLHHQRSGLMIINLPQRPDLARLRECRGCVPGTARILKGEYIL